MNRVNKYTFFLKRKKKEDFVTLGTVVALRSGWSSVQAQVRTKLGRCSGTKVPLSKVQGALRCAGD